MAKEIYPEEMRFIADLTEAVQKAMDSIYTAMGKAHSLSMEAEFKSPDISIDVYDSTGKIGVVGYGYDGDIAFLIEKED